MPSTTPIRHYPYPLDADGIDTAGDIRRLAEALDTDIGSVISQAIPGGTVLMTIAPAPPPGWALFLGQAIANAQTLYPETWAAAPASWKAGSSLTLPDMSGRFPIAPGGAAVLGQVGSTANRTLAIAHMPFHSHAGVTTTETANHFHTAYTDVQGNHNHYSSGDPAVNLIGAVLGSGQTMTLNNPANGPGIGYYTFTSVQGAHQHYVQTGGVSANHQHYVYGEGGGQAFDIIPPFLSLNFIVRLR